MNLKIVPTPEFKKLTKKLAKNYKKLPIDLKNFQKELQKNPRLGTYLGNNCYKVRLPNSSIPTGKSGGFRVITYYIDESSIIRLLTIYSKRDQASLSNKEIEELIDKTLNT
jgi:mRNA-degrading endonuclease RelE of RelBE toxin-antitoxin system